MLFSNKIPKLLPNASRCHCIWMENHSFNLTNIKIIFQPSVGWICDISLSDIITKLKECCALVCFEFKRAFSWSINIVGTFSTYLRWYGWPDIVRNRAEKERQMAVLPFKKNNSPMNRRFWTSKFWDENYLIRFMKRK